MSSINYFSPLGNRKSVEMPRILVTKYWQVRLLGGSFNCTETLETRFSSYPLYSV